MVEGGIRAEHRRRGALVAGSELVDSFERWDFSHRALWRPAFAIETAGLPCLDAFWVVLLAGVVPAAWATGDRPSIPMGGRMTVIATWGVAGVSSGYRWSWCWKGSCRLSGSASRLAEAPCSASHGRHQRLSGRLSAGGAERLGSGIRVLEYLRAAASGVEHERESPRLSSYGAEAASGGA